MGGPGVTKYPFYLGVHIEQECYEQGLWFLNKTTRPEHKTSDSFLKKKKTVTINMEIRYPPSNVQAQNHITDPILK